MRATKEYRLSCTEEAKKIVDRLTLEQKVWLMSGNIDITSLGGMNVDFSGKENTLIIRHRDTPGMIALVTGALASRQMNIATMQVFRRDAGAEAIMVLEHGEIIERGDHDELLKLKGRYYELYTGLKELD